MISWRWMVHLCGRASPRAFARIAASWFGATRPRWRLPLGTSQQALQCESMTWAGAVSWRRRKGTHDCESSDGDEGGDDDGKRSIANCQSGLLGA
eukprot:3288301-Pyramimonas_sp.AAC.1